MTRVDVGWPWTRRRAASTSQHHIVTWIAGEWAVLCTGSKAVRSHLGWLETVTCEACRTKHRATG